MGNANRRVNFVDLSSVVVAKELAHSIRDDTTAFHTSTAVFVDSAHSSTSSTPSLTPSASRKHRRLTWGDDEGHGLTDLVSFRKDDEAWRLSKKKLGPLTTALGLPTCEVSLNAHLPSSNAEMMDRLTSAHVQLESVMIRFNTVFVFVMAEVH